MMSDKLNSEEMEDIFVSSIATFPQKLYAMSMFEFSQGDAIKWSPDGKSFKVVDSDKFSDEIIPKYFKRENILSI